MDSTAFAQPRRRLPQWAKFVLLAGVLVGAGVVAVRWGEMRSALESGVYYLREKGPLVFFVSMALLPAVGFPLMPFTFAAGPVFGPTIGVANVIVCAICAVMVNVALTYWLAARALRPLVSRLADLLGYRLPESGAQTAWQVTTIVRLAPGLPFFMQSYLLGLVRTPFAVYMTVSTLVPAGYLVAVILFGDALWTGKAKNIALAASLLGIVAGIIHLLRKRQAAMTRKSATPANNTDASSGNAR